MVRVVTVELRDSRGLAADNFVVDPYRQQKDAIQGSKRQHRQCVQKGVDRNPKTKAEEGFDPAGNLDKFCSLIHSIGYIVIVCFRAFRFMRGLKNKMLGGVRRAFLSIHQFVCQKLLVIS